MSRRLFSHNPEFGITKYWHYDDDTDTAVIESVQDIEPMLERLQKERNAQTRLDRWKDGMHKVAEVPMATYSEWLAHGLDKDQSFLKRWINDPANLKYRNFRGRV